MAGNVASKIAIDDLVEAAASGALRALRVREGSAADLVRSGFGVNIVVVAGGPRFLAQAALNPQPEPPGVVDATGAAEE